MLDQKTIAIARATTRAVSVCRTNDFQQGIDELREEMQSRIGETVVMDKDDAFVAPPGGAEWGGPQRVTGIITEVLHHGHFICAARFGDEPRATPLTASSFLLDTTTWGWKTQTLRDDGRAVAVGAKHERSVERARFVMSEAIARIPPRDLRKAIAVTLDGNGENRRGFELALDEAGVPLAERPQVITVEMNPVVAFNQALRFGPDNVRYSRGDWRRRRKRGVPEGIERLLTEESGALFTSDEKERVRILYLDYCGSPATDFKYEELYTRLQNLVVCGITVARRQPNPKLPCMTRMRAAAPSGMALAKRFEHTKVVCDVYVAPAAKRAAKRAAKPTKPTKLIAKRDAARLLGTEVRIPLTKWVGGVGDEWADTMRVDGKLCFVVHSTFYKHRCALRARKKNGELYATTERILLTPDEVRAYAA